MPTNLYWKYGLYFPVLWILFAFLLDFSLTTTFSGPFTPEAFLQTIATYPPRWLIWVGSALLVLGAAAPLLIYLHRSERRIEQVRQFSGRIAAWQFECAGPQERRTERGRTGTEQSRIYAPKFCTAANRGTESFGRHFAQHGGRCGGHRTRAENRFQQ